MASSPSWKLLIGTVPRFWLPTTVLQPVGVPWIAQFGVYTPSIRTPDLIPGQVRLLHSFLVGREQQVKTITLADDRNGTYVER